MPYMRSDDVRQKQLAARIDEMSQQYITESERINSFAVRCDRLTMILLCSDDVIGHTHLDVVSGHST